MCATGQPGNDFLSDVGLVVAVGGEVVAEEEEGEEREEGEEDGRQLVGLMSEVRLSCGGGFTCVHYTPLVPNSRRHSLTCNTSQTLA